MYPPGPRVFTALRLLPAISSDPLGVAERIRQQYGGIARLAIGKKCVIFVSDPQVALDVLHDSDRFPQKGPGVRSAARFLGRGLLTVPSSDAKLARRTISDYFTHTNADAFI